jgi:hypothetical protein
VSFDDVLLPRAVVRSDMDSPWAPNDEQNHAIRHSTLRELPDISTQALRSSRMKTATLPRPRIIRAQPSSGIDAIAHQCLVEYACSENGIRSLVALMFRYWRLLSVLVSPAPSGHPPHRSAFGDVGLLAKLGTKRMHGSKGHQLYEVWSSKTPSICLGGAVSAVAAWQGADSRAWIGERYVVHSSLLKSLAATS